MSDTDVQLCDGDAATAQVLLTAFTDVGLDKLVGARRAFVNVPYAFLTDGFCQTLPTDRVVLEILEDVHVDRHVIKTAETLVAAGHTLALDDFTFRDGIEPLVELADIVKLDVLALSTTELDDHVERLRPYGVTLLAEKIEAADQIPSLPRHGLRVLPRIRAPTPHHRARRQQQRKQIGVVADRRRRQPPQHRADRPRRHHRMRPVDRVHALAGAQQCPRLPRTRHFLAARRALVLLGIDGIRNWTLMMVMSRLAGGSHETIANTLVRAKMCQLCAPTAGPRTRRFAFTAGLLSTLCRQSSTGQLPDVVSELGLTPELHAALTDHREPSARSSNGSSPTKPKTNTNSPTPARHS